MRRAAMLAAVFALGAISAAVGSSASAETCKDPDWKHRPSWRELLGVWPRDALAKGVNGAAKISCTVSIEGALRDCTVVSEDPPGSGFGRAAIALTPQFVMNPKVCDGHPAEATVNIPVNFEGLAGPASPPGSRIPGGPGSDAHGPVVMDRPEWIEAPTYAQVVAAYPPLARKDKVSGHVALECAYGDGGRLRHCDIISEIPKGYGLGEAARDLSKDFMAPDTDAAGRKIRNAATSVAFTFDLDMLNGQTPVIGTPQWTHVPQGVDLAAGFPPAATAAHVPVGHVTMGCDVGPGGHLLNCAVSRQAPEGLGFDKAALALSAVFQVTVWTDEGLPTVGGHITVPIRYEAPEPSPAAQSK
jgi:TonB family protein